MIDDDRQTNKRKKYCSQKDPFYFSFLHSMTYPFFPKPWHRSPGTLPM